jgi:hypothetical protein
MGKEHPHKEIASAIRYAINNGWKFRKATGHAFGVLMCPDNSGCRGGLYCRFSISSTPRNPESHARRIRNIVDGCSIGGE